MNLIDQEDEFEEREEFEAADDLEAPVESPVSGEDQEEGLLPLEYPEELLEGEVARGLPEQDPLLESNAE